MTDNEEKVVNVVQSHRFITIQDLQKQTGFDDETLVKILAPLIDSGVIKEQEGLLSTKDNPTVSKAYSAQQSSEDAQKWYKQNALEATRNLMSLQYERTKDLLREDGEFKDYLRVQAEITKLRFEAFKDAGFDDDKAFELTLLYSDSHQG